MPRPAAGRRARGVPAVATGGGPGGPAPEGSRGMGVPLRVLPARRDPSAGGKVRRRTGDASRCGPPAQGGCRPWSGAAARRSLQRGGIRAAGRARSVAARATSAGGAPRCSRRGAVCGARGLRCPSPRGVPGARGLPAGGSAGLNDADRRGGRAQGGRPLRVPARLVPRWPPPRPGARPPGAGVCAGPTDGAGRRMGQR